MLIRDGVLHVLDCGCVSGGERSAVVCRCLSCDRTTPKGLGSERAILGAIKTPRCDFSAILARNRGNLLNLDEFDCFCGDVEVYIGNLNQKPIVVS